MNIDLNDISETALIMVLCHVHDALSNNPILNDQSAIPVLEYLQSLNFTENRKLQKLLQKRKVSPFLSKLIVARALYYDNCCIEFLKRHPSGTIVNIGCGLDLRYQRIQHAGQCQFIDIDLPKIIDVKNVITKEADDYKMIGQSVFDYSWMDALRSKQILFLAEGVFMYCNEVDIKELFIHMANHFPKTEMICELSHKIYSSKLMHLMSKPSIQFQYGIGTEAAFQFGVRHSRELEQWHPQITWIKDRSFFNLKQDESFLINKMQYLPFAKKQFWTAHYKF